MNDDRPILRLVKQGGKLPRFKPPGWVNEHSGRYVEWAREEDQETFSGIKLVLLSPNKGASGREKVASRLVDMTTGFIWLAVKKQTRVIELSSLSFPKIWPHYRMRLAANLLLVADKRSITIPNREALDVQAMLAKFEGVTINDNMKTIRHRYYEN